MSTTALHLIQLIKSLPLEDQRAVYEALAKQASLLRAAAAAIPAGSGTPVRYDNPNGIPNDHPFFKIMEEDEAARRKDPGPPPPEFD